MPCLGPLPGLDPSRFNIHLLFLNRPTPTQPCGLSRNFHTNATTSQPRVEQLASRMILYIYSKTASRSGVSSAAMTAGSATCTLLRSASPLGNYALCCAMHADACIALRNPSSGLGGYLTTQSQERRLHASWSTHPRMRRCGSYHVVRTAMLQSRTLWMYSLEN
ncbi:hypothetical protein BD779DRAFT_164520 [Infundibulicybe gibba]|nr:hypothetical protein BD779DRAFT_164520 [Infundibulicybe gibba]